MKKPRMIKQKWLRIDEENYYIFIPDSDVQPHGFVKEGEMEADLAGMDCPCKPKTEMCEDGSFIIVHNSFQDKERLEYALKVNFKN